MLEVKQVKQPRSMRCGIRIEELMLRVRHSPVTLKRKEKISGQSLPVTLEKRALKDSPNEGEFARHADQHESSGILCHRDQHLSI